MLIADGLVKNIRSRREPGGTLRRGDRAAIADLGGDEINISAGGTDDSLIIDARVGAAHKIEIAALEELLVCDVESRAEKPGRVDATIRPNDDSARIDQIDHAVGLERPINKRGISSQNAVERGRGTVRDQKLGQFSAVDGKLLQIDDRRTA